MDLRQLKYFLAIAEEEQITKAAKKLHIAQPHLSRELKLLEDELGLSLAERGNKKISLTEAGKLLQIKAEKIIELSESTLDDMQSLKEGLAGSIRIGTVSSSGPLILSSKILDFHKTYPKLKFEIWEGNTYKMLDLLDSEIIDLALVRSPFSFNNYSSLVLAEEPMIAVMHKDLDWTSSKKISLSDLRDRPLIIYRRFENLILELARRENFEPSFICKNDDARTSLLWAKSGLGICLVPQSSINLINKDQLVYKEIDHPLLVTQVLAIWLNDKPLSQSSQNFIDHLEKNLS